MQFGISGATSGHLVVAILSAEVGIERGFALCLGINVVFMLPRSCVYTGSRSIRLKKS